MNCKYIILLVACGIALSAALPANQGDGAHEQEELDLSAFVEAEDQLQHVRLPRSPMPEGGSVDVNVRKDQGGREASVQYNQNLYTSKDGRGSIDAYANAQRNFDQNRNNFGGGIQGRWRF